MGSAARISLLTSHVILKMSHQYKFPKAEHLCLKRDIERLFSAGTKSLSAYPLRVVVGAAETGSVPVKVLMSVSKRRLHHAVDRNRAKRKLRESFFVVGSRYV